MARLLWVGVKCIRTVPIYYRPKVPPAPYKYIADNNMLINHRHHIYPIPGEVFRITVNNREQPAVGRSPPPNFPSNVQCGVSIYLYNFSFCIYSMNVHGAAVCCVLCVMCDVTISSKQQGSSCQNTYTKQHSSASRSCISLQPMFIAIAHRLIQNFINLQCTRASLP